MNYRKIWSACSTGFLAVLILFTTHKPVECFESSRSLATPPNLLVFAGADEEGYQEVLQAPVKPMSKAEFTQLNEETMRRFKSRCTGLLELICQGEGPGTITYLHRTVKDLSHSRILHARLWRGVENFSTYTAASLMGISLKSRINLPSSTTNRSWRKTRIGSQDFGLILDSILQSLEHCLQSQNITGDAHLDFIHALESVLRGGNETFWSRMHIACNATGDMSQPLALIMLCGYHNYIQAALESGSNYSTSISPQQATHLLVLALRDDRQFRFLGGYKTMQDAARRDISPKLLKLLLDHGAETEWLKYQAFSRTARSRQTIPFVFSATEIEVASLLFKVDV
jgi:hypothetical protein